jgi:hypothetical protein
MIIRLNGRTARMALSLGALALTAVVFAVPVGARPNPTPRQWCMSRCHIGEHACFQYCDTVFPKKASISPARRPITRTVAPAPSTHLHR